MNNMKMPYGTHTREYDAQKNLPKAGMFVSKVIAGMIPGAGGTLLELINVIDAENIERQLEVHENRIKALEDKNREFYLEQLAKDKECNALFRLSLLKARFCYRREQFDGIAKTVEDAVLNNKITKQQAETVMAYICELTYEEYRTLAVLVEIIKYDIHILVKGDNKLIKTCEKDEFGLYERLNNIPGVISLIERLISKGLIIGYCDKTENPSKDYKDIIEYSLYMYSYYGCLVAHVLFDVELESQID